MELNLFGFQIKKKGQEPKKLQSPISPTLDDGATISQTGAAYYSTVLDLDGVIKGENDLIRRYRACAEYSDVDSAIEDIVNEAISTDDDEVVVSIVLDRVKVGDGIKKKIEEEFGNITTLLKFDERSHEIFRQWYIDGRIYYNVMADKDNLKEGIKELRYVDPRKIRKIKIMKREKSPSGVELVTVQEEYYLFNDKGVTESSTSGVKMSLDSIVYVPSGNFDANTGMALSFLNKAVKPTNQLKMLEDAMVIFRITRAPERRIFYVDVGNLPKMKAEQYVQDIMNKFKNKVVYDASTGEVRDDRKHMCLDMDTKVPLLDGRVLSLKQITEEYNAGKSLWAYSCDPITGKFVPGLITWAGVARKDAQVMKLTLDNGKTIICTPDHKFPVWNKGLVRADELSVNESMIPRYERLAKLGTKTAQYEQIFDNEAKEWKFTHRLVSNWKNEVQLENEYTFNEEYISEKKTTVHHKNINCHDNSPENLTKMDSQDHFKMHSVIGTNGGKIGGPKVKELGLGYFNKNHPQYTEWHVNAGEMGGSRTVELEVGIHANGMNEELRARFIEKMKDPIYNVAFCLNQKNNWNESNKAIMSDFAKSSDLSGRGNVAQKILWADEEYSKNRAKKYKTLYLSSQFEHLDFCASQQMTKAEAVQHINSNCSVTEWKELNVSNVGTQKDWGLGINSGDVNRMVHALGLSSWAQYQIALEFRNHKIAKIEYLNETMDVGCLTIDGDEIYHNHHTFALDAGIYTQNSMIEDFWMPRREGGKGTEITTLPGLQNANNIEDVTYFQTKLWQALNVPASRNQPGNVFSSGRGSEITRDEIKFSKFVSRLRIKFSQLFYELLRIQLQMKGIVTAEDWAKMHTQITLKYAKDNHYAEFKENEILTQRMQLLMLLDPQATAVGKYYSIPWIRKNVLRQDEEEMKEIDKEMEETAANNPPPVDTQPTVSAPTEQQ